MYIANKLLIFLHSPKSVVGLMVTRLRFRLFSQSLSSEQNVIAYFAETFNKSTLAMAATCCTETIKPMRKFFGFILMAVLGLTGGVTQRVRAQRVVDG